MFKTTPEGFEQVEAMVKDQYEPRVELLRRTKLSDGVEIPSLQETIDLLGENTTDQQVAEILRMQKAALTLEPKKPFAHYVFAIDANRREGQQPTQVSAYLQKRFAAMPSGNGVSIGFVEGLPKLAGDPSLMGRKLKYQEEDMKRGLAEGVSIIAPRSYALLQLDGMQTDNLVDGQLWSALEDGSTERSFLPGADLYSNFVCFYGGDLEEGSHNVRWRRSVMVEKN